MGGADFGVLRVYKGLHTMQGYRLDEMHVTMDMKIPGSEQHSLVEYSLFAGAFHFKAKIEGSRPTKGGYEISACLFVLPGGTKTRDKGLHPRSASQLRCSQQRVAPVNAG